MSHHHDCIFSQKYQSNQMVYNTWEKNKWKLVSEANKTAHEINQKHTSIYVAWVCPTICFSLCHNTSFLGRISIREICTVFKIKWSNRSTIYCAYKRIGTFNLPYFEPTQYVRSYCLQIIEVHNGSFFCVYFGF